MRTSFKTLARQPAGAFDLLLVDAFSSDAVPAHLLTTEAMRLYLSRLKPDGVLLMHISNRHLDLARPAYAAAQAAGAAAVVKHYKPAPDAAARMALPQVVIQVARAPSQLIPSPGQDVTPVEAGRPWTDDYTNIVGAILARR